MNTVTQHSQYIDTDETYTVLSARLHDQREAYHSDPVPDIDQRKKDLLALKNMLSENREAIADAINADYGSRARQETMLAEIIMVLDGINFAIRHLKQWMRTQKRKIEFTLYPGAKNRVIPQPLGVVGVIVPWNFPIQMVFTPLTYIFAAGNRAMVKMSENSRQLSRLLIKLVPDYFPPEKLSI